MVGPADGQTTKEQKDQLLLELGSEHVFCPSGQVGVAGELLQVKQSGGECSHCRTEPRGVHIRLVCGGKQLGHDGAKLVDHRRGRQTEQMMQPVGHAPGLQGRHTGVCEVMLQPVGDVGEGVGDGRDGEVLGEGLLPVAIEGVWTGWMQRPASVHERIQRGSQPVEAGVVDDVSKLLDLFPGLLRGQGLWSEKRCETSGWDRHGASGLGPGHGPGSPWRHKHEECQPSNRGRWGFWWKGGDGNG